MSTIPQPLPSSDLSNILQAWYYDFIRSYSLEIQFQLILAANYLDIKPLLDLSCAIIASQIKGKTIQEIRDHFHIVNDFTLIEEEQIREEMKWCDVTLPEN